jgi:hypothetical protein
MAQANDLVGQHFGRLEVLRRAGTRNAGGNAEFYCRCKCGNECIKLGSRLLSGEAQSCGCLAREIKDQRKASFLRGQHFMNRQTVRFHGPKVWLRRTA